MKWKTIILDNTESIYEVNNKGEVRNKNTMKLISAYPNEKGYLRVSMWCNQKRYLRKVHRLVATYFIKGETKIRNEINHIDGDKSNNDYKNLEWVSHEENIKHSMDNFLFKNYGENHPLSKYTTKEITEVCNLLEAGFTVAEISLKLKINKNYIQSIKRGERWQTISKFFNFTKNKNKKSNDYPKHKKIIVTVDLRKFLCC